VRVIEPGRHEHRTLESESIAVTRLRKAIEAAIQDVAREQKLKRLIALLGNGEQPRAYGRAHVADRFRHRW
jgi:hypothetical protein